MIIGLIGDTHISDRAREIPKEILDFLSGSDVIIHTGDVTDAKVLDILSKITSEIKVVRGNLDYLDFREDLYMEIDDIKLYVFHSDIIYPRGDLDQIYEYVKNYKKLNVDFIIFGHTHLPLYTYYKGIYFLNPGSATGVRSGEYKDVRKSAAILDTTTREVKFKYVVNN